MVEKPIGHDLHSALHIISSMRKCFAESQIFRIDHYLGKETVQNLMVLRFGNAHLRAALDSATHRPRADHRGRRRWAGHARDYYDSAGALRDMVQNHMLQVLALIAMEPPSSLAADAVRDEKCNVMRSLRPFDPEACAQAGGARPVRRGRRRRQAGARLLARRKASARPAAPRPSSRSSAQVDNWRWAGVPFYLRTGKRLPRRASTIFVQFKRVPEILFNRRVTLSPDVLAIRIQPDEGFSLEVLAKRPGLDITIQPVRMDLHYAAEFGNDSPDAYERLLLDVMAGDHTLFLGSRFVQRSWEFVQGISRSMAGRPGNSLGALRGRNLGA